MQGPTQNNPPSTTTPGTQASTTTQSPSSKSLNDVLKDLRDEGEKVLSLDVMTYIGNLVVQVDETPKQTLDKLFESLKTEKGQGTLRLVAATHRGIDHSVTSICMDQPNAAEAALLAAHKEMYIAAEHARAELIRLVLETVKGVVGA
jgi:hypothetical protein